MKNNNVTPKKRLGNVGFNLQAPNSTPNNTNTDNTHTNGNTNPIVNNNNNNTINNKTYTTSIKNNNPIKHNPPNKQIFIPQFRPNKNLSSQIPVTIKKVEKIESDNEPKKPLKKERNFNNNNKFNSKYTPRFTPNKHFHSQMPNLSKSVFTPTPSNSMTAVTVSPLEKEEKKKILSDNMDIEEKTPTKENILVLEKKKKKKKNVIEFNEIDDGKKSNTPIVTPWNNPYLHLFNQTKTKIPFPKNSPASELFYNESGVRLEDGTLFLVQLPSILPNNKMVETYKKNEEIALENLKKKSTTHRYTPNPPTFASCLGSLENGKMGKMIIYKSGKIKLKLGDCLFDISQGTSTKFHQEAVCVSQSSNIYFFGDVLQTMVVTPNINSLISGQKADSILNQTLQNGDLMEDEDFLKPVSTPIKNPSNPVKKKVLEFKK